MHFDWLSAKTGRIHALARCARSVILRVAGFERWFVESYNNCTTIEWLRAKRATRRSLRQRFKCHARCSDALLAPEGIKNAWVNIYAHVAPLALLVWITFGKKEESDARYPLYIQSCFRKGKTPPMNLSQQINFRIILGSSVGTLPESILS